MEPTVQDAVMIQRTMMSGTDSQMPGSSVGVWAEEGAPSEQSAAPSVSHPARRLMRCTSVLSWGPSVGACWCTVLEHLLERVVVVG